MMFGLLSLCCFMLAVSSERVLLYYAPTELANNAFIKSLHAKIDQAKNYLEEHFDELSATRGPEEMFHAEIGAHIIDVFSKLSSDSIGRDVCRADQIENLNPCIKISFEPVTNKCKIVYKCKIVDVVGANTKAVAPITKDEAKKSLRSSLAKRRPKYL
jgi:hypothetical protein